MLVLILAMVASALLGFWYGHTQLLHGFERGFSAAMDWEHRALMHMAEQCQFEEAITFIDAKLAVSHDNERRQIRKSLNDDKLPTV